MKISLWLVQAYLTQSIMLHLHTQSRRRVQFSLSSWNPFGNLYFRKNCISPLENAVTMQSNHFLRPGSILISLKSLTGNNLSLA